MERTEIRRKYFVLETIEELEELKKQLISFSLDSSSVLKIQINHKEEFCFFNKPMSFQENRVFIQNIKANKIIRDIILDNIDAEIEKLKLDIVNSK